MISHHPLDRKLFTVPFVFFLLIFLIGLFFIIERFIFGMGAVSNLNDGFAWGIWVVYDIVIGTAFACGGYAVALTVYILNKGEYHPLVRPAILTSLLGYALGGFGAFFDMGRWWQFYNIFLPWNWNFNSVLLEVGLCVALYITVLAIEFSPAFLEKIGAKPLLKFLNKFMFFFIALGIVLPTMHQSSLGTLLIAMGHKVHPLWQTLHFQPLLAILTALTMGFSIVIFEGAFSTISFRLHSETQLHKNLGKAIMGLLITFLVIRLGLLLTQGNISYLFRGDMASMLYILETVLFIVPIVVLASPARRADGGNLLFAAITMLLAGALYRFDAFLLTLNPGPGYSYFPSIAEMMITFGIISFEIMLYLIFVKTMPVLPVVHHEKHA